MLMKLEPSEPLCEFLQRCRHDILDTWRARAEADAKLRSANSLSYRQFKDHIPNVLDELYRRLKDENTHKNGTPIAWSKHDLAKHGFHRWQQGYQLSEVARDWSHLHKAILEVIESFLMQGGDPKQAVPAYRIVADLMHTGALDSTLEYEKLRALEAEAHLQEMRRNMILVGEAEPVEALDFSHVIHDLKHEVALISGTTKLFEGELDDNTRQRATKYLKHGVVSMESMIGDMLTLTTLNAGQDQRKLETIDIEQLLESIMGKCAPTAESLGLYLKREKTKLPPIQTDPGKLTRVAQNLIVNALRHTRQGGITLRWGNSHIHEHWFLSVEDTGPGLKQANNPEFVQKLEPIREQENSHAGNQTNGTLCAATPNQNGLGLSIVKRLCDLLDASLELDPEYKDGTRFVIHLPYRYEAK